jgi:ribosomal-protein-alanine N-acetyltransferase
MSEFPTLQTQRLHLREITATDATALLAIHGDTQAMRWFGTDPMTDLPQAEKLVDVFAAWRKLHNPGVRWGIALQDRDALIGTCGLFKWNRGWRCCTLGYELAQRAWGQGYMHEALTAALDWGFEHMALNRIEVQVHPDNTASLRSVQALGFQYEGRIRQAGFWLGEYHDLLQYGLLRSDYPRPTPS